jgi:hypothetical protein
MERISAQAQEIMIALDVVGDELMMEKDIDPQKVRQMMKGKH